MKRRFTAGLLIAAAVIPFLIMAQAGESFSLETALSSIERASAGANKNRDSQPETENSAGAARTLEALISEVLESNPELKFYEAGIAAAKGQRRTAGVWSNPEVNGSVGHKRVSAGEGGGSESGVASEIAVTQLLEWPGRIRLRKAIADRDIELAELGLEQFRTLLAARTKIAAYALVTAREKAAATREVADHFHSLREVLVERDQAGLTAILETRVIEAMELNIQRRASEALLASQAVLLDLNQLRGASPDDTMEIVKINLEFRPFQKNKGELITLARTGDFQVRLRAMELERQGYQVKLAKNERFPAITAGPAISSERAGDRERIIGAAISLPLPLWDRNQGNVAAAKARQAQAEASFDVAQREAERRAAESVLIYETKLREMANWRPDSIRHFKEAAELADRHYRLGAVPVSTYVDLQSQYLDTLEGLLDTKKEALEAAVRLETLTDADLSLTTISSEGA